MKGDDEKLMNLSAASADRLLRPAREAMRMKGRSGTRSPGSSLNTMIPIRAYYTMDERCEAGFFEIDTVVHCGYGPQEGALWTLTLTDVSNGWVYIRALKAKTQRCVLEALDDILDHQAYPIRELHMDNGTEFKNFGFLQWCQRHGIAYTRSRSYHKNDNCFVEAKNFSSAYAAERGSAAISTSARAISTFLILIGCSPCQPPWSVIPAGAEVFLRISDDGA